MNATATVRPFQASSTYASIRASVESIKNDDHATIETMSPGDVVRQGDIYIVNVGDHVTSTRAPYPGYQLADGETQGSRHVVTSLVEISEVKMAADSSLKPKLVRCNIETRSWVALPTLLVTDTIRAAYVLAKLIPAAAKHEQFFGPTIHATHPFTVTHPEHGDRTLPAGNYLVTYQRTWANQIRRTQD